MPSMTNQWVPDPSAQNPPPAPPPPGQVPPPPSGPLPPQPQAEPQQAAPYGQQPTPPYGHPSEQLPYGQQPVPPAYGQPTPPAPPAPPRRQLNLNIPSAAWIRAAVVVALLLGGSLVGSGLIVALGLPQASQPELGLGGKWFPLLIQILGMGYGASAHASIDADVGGLGSVGASFSLFAVPVLVPVLGLVAVRLFGRKVSHGITAPSWLPRLALAVAGGLAFATVVTVVSAIARFTIPLDGDLGADTAVSVHTAGFLGYLYQFAVAAVVVYVVFLPRQGSGYWQRTLRDVAVTVTEHVLSLVIVLGLVITIVMAVKSQEPKLLFFAPLLLPYVGLVGTGMIHLVSFGYSGGAGTGGLLQEFGDDLGSRKDSVTVFSDAFPAWVWPVAVLIALIWIVVVALRWRLRRGLPGKPSQDPLSWVLLPAAYLVVGLALLVTSWAAGSVEGGAGGLASAEAKAGVHLAWWVFFVMALVGLVVEVVSRWVIPGMARTMPRALLTALVVGAHREPTTASGTPAAPGERGAPLLTEGHQRSPRAKRWWFVGLIAALALGLVVAGSAVAYSLVAKNVYGPDKQARTYLDAVVDGRAEDAMAVFAPNVKKDARVLLTDQVYSEAEKRPTSYSITDTEVSDETATVTYSLTMDGKTYKDQVMYLERHGKQAVVFSDWEVVDAPMQSVTIASGPTKLKVNGADVELKGLQMGELGESDSSDDYEDYGDEPTEGMSLPVLPGEYTFAAPEASKYVTYGDDVTLDVQPGQEQVTEGFAPRYTQAVIDDATAQVKKKVDSCVGSTAEYPKGCELSGWVWDEKGDEPFKMSSRTWDEEPEISVVSGEYGDSAEDASDLSGEISVRVDARVKVSYKYKFDKEDKDWNDASRTYSLHDPDDEWGYSLQLPVTVDGDELKVDLDAFSSKTDNNG
jgi:hypothetical protein